MIILLDTPPCSWDDAVSDIGGTCEIGQLLTPLTRYADRGLTYAIDNGAFARFSPAAFESLLSRQRDHRGRCLFVCAPDIVANARRTLEVFDHWLPKLDGWPVALVAQDGIEDIAIPWQWVSAVFIGGTDKFKSSQCVTDVVKAAKAIGKWVHMGRVNTRDRFIRCAEIGVDSIDGTGISRYTHMRTKMVDDSSLFVEAGN